MRLAQHLTVWLSTFNEQIIGVGITPAELSTLTNFSESRIIDLMSGKASILSLELNELLPIARAMGMTANELVDRLCDC